MNVVLTMTISLRAADIVPGLVFAELGDLAIVSFATLLFGATSSALLALTYIRRG